MSDDNDQRKAVPPSPRSMRELLGEQAEKVPAPADPREGEVVLGEGCASLPERLLLHHAEGEVLFLAGAGVSMPKPACLPSFTKLVLKVYKQLGDPVLPHLEALAGKEVEWPEGPPLKPDQKAEVKSFENGQLDVVLGILERRIDGQQTEESRMRQAVVDVLQPDPPPEHSGIHRDLIRLSDRGGPTAILTTNFDLLLEAAAKRVKSSVESLALGAIPRPSLRPSFSGVLHLHGALSPDRSGIPDLILTNRDFGEFYLRRRVVPDLLYDAARIYNLVLVGYTASDPPVRYLLDAISADDARFPDLKERFIFVPFKGKEPEEVALADWKARGLTPISYSRADKHRQLAFTLEAWAGLFEKRQALGDGHETVTERRVRETLERMTERPLSEVSDEDRSLFDHLIRREGGTRRAQLAYHLGNLGRSYEWLDRILDVIRGPVELVGQEPAPHAPPSGEVERRAAQCVQNFALTRLEERATIDWARQLPALDRASRRGLQRLLSNRANWGEGLSEPWSEAWQLVEKSWCAPAYAAREEALTTVWEIKERLERGDRSLVLAEKMAEFVAPWLRLDEPAPVLEVRGVESPEPPVWGHLFRAELRSVRVSELLRIDLDGVSRVEFLSFLVGSLEGSVRRGLDLARCIGWKGDFRFLRLGGLFRVRLVRSEAGDEEDLDLWGIAPCVKLLHTAVERLAQLDRNAASRVVRRWLYTECPVRRRLWAAFALDEQLATSREVGGVLLRLDDWQFWSDVSPELMELRLSRFKDLDAETRAELLDRIRVGPPRDYWVPSADANQVEDWSLDMAVHEMERIRDAGVELPAQHQRWLAAELTKRPDRHAAGTGRPMVKAWAPERADVQPDRELDGYTGSALLDQLEQRLVSEKPFYSGSAGTWLKKRTNKVLAAMAGGAGGPLDLPHLWRAFAEHHRPPREEGAESSLGDPDAEAAAVLELVETLSDETLAKALRELVRWWLNWESVAKPNGQARRVWLRLWPHAVARTTASSSSMSFKTEMANTPAGDLGRIAWMFARHLGQRERLSNDRDFARIVAAILKAPCRARTLGLAHMVCSVSWFLQVDQDWTERYLIVALRKRSESTVDLWEALCSFGLRWGVPKILAANAVEVLERTDAPKLSAGSRQRLASALVIDSLRAFFDGSEPVIESVQLRQLISRLDGEVRRVCAAELWRSLRPCGDRSPSPEEAFRRAVSPFLRRVWPQELNLVSRGVSRFMAGIPAASRGEFVAAVDAVARFLVHGSTESRHDYGLHGEEDGEEVLDATVDSPEKAEALLRLLDLTVGDEEGVFAPLGLDELLARIRKKAPALVERPEFARLTTMAQRSRFE